jgi:hypothetical protein
LNLQKKKYVEAVVTSLKLPKNSWHCLDPPDEGRQQTLPKRRYLPTDKAPYGPTNVPKGPAQVEFRFFFFFFVFFFLSSTTLDGFWLAQVILAIFFFLSKTLFFQSRTPITSKSFRTLSGHLSLRLPFGLFNNVGAQLVLFLVIRCSSFFEYAQTIQVSSLLFVVKYFA